MNQKVNKKKKNNNNKNNSRNSLVFGRWPQTKTRNRIQPFRSNWKMFLRKDFEMSTFIVGSNNFFHLGGANFFNAVQRLPVNPVSVKQWGDFEEISKSTKPIIV